MGIKYIDGKRLEAVMIAGSKWIAEHEELLNDLNVYPVPDGDTGTNMCMTAQAIEDELNKSDETDTQNVIQTISEAALLGARGNSGTILSQIIQGFLSGIIGKEKIYAVEIAEALDKSQKAAYKSVSNPVEGTILTVVRRVAEEAKEFVKSNDNLDELIRHLRKTAESAVEETPEQLDKLKEAGVVDAGGQGFFFLLQGIEKFIIEGEINQNKQIKKKEKEESNYNINIEDIKFIYCTEFIVGDGSFNLDKFKEKLDSYGDSIVTVQSNKKTKAHIHTNNPGQVLEYAMTYGDLESIKIENMKLQHSNKYLDENKAEEEVIFSEDKKSKIGYILVADTKEIADQFIKNGASAVIIGGQTKNPSVKVFEETIKNLDKEELIILPNNKNIISSAKLASERSDKKIIVLESKSMLEGSYILNNKNDNLETILKHTNNNISFEITKAVRDSKSGDLLIKENNFIGLVNGKIEFSSSDLLELVNSFFKKYYDEKTIKINVIKGKTEDKTVNELLKKYYKNIYHNDFYGNQENYSYYIYLERKMDDIGEIAVLTDSTSDITKESIQDLPLNIIPLKVKFDKDYYKEGVEITKDEFWNELENSDFIPMTSQPSPGDFLEYYNKMFQKGYKKIISIHVSSKLSGTLNAARTARSMTGREEDVIIIDSLSASLGLGHMALEAARLAKENEKLEEIVSLVEKMVSKFKLYLSIRDIKYLEKNGRIGKAQSKIGGILNLKPIITLKNGEVYPEKKCFGEGGVVKYLSKIIKEESKKGSVIVYNCFGGKKENIKASDAITSKYENNSKAKNMGKFEIGAIIGSHTGPLFGIIIFPKVY